ncbi:MAG: KH domain-containing protein [Spirochaetaceae bacterium]|nr:KH domain-containing protein [Spirochaetaceae bacterium]
MQKDLIDFIVKTLVDDPSAVVVNEVPGEKATVLELKVNSDDIGKIIGKQGRIAKAMRTILNASASKDGKKYILEIID